MARLASLQAGVKEATALLDEVEDLVLEDDSISFKLNGEDYSLFFSGSYPGPCKVYGGDVDFEFTGSVIHVLREVISALSRGEEDRDDDAMHMDIDDEDGEGRGISPLRQVRACADELRAEAEELRRLYLTECMDVEPFGDGCRVVLRVNPTVGGAVTELTAEAWGIDLKSPICIRSLLEVRDYEQRRPPPLQLYQGEFGKESKLGPQKQLQDICDAFCQAWQDCPMLSNGSARATGPGVTGSPSDVDEESSPSRRRRRVEATDLQPDVPQGQARHAMEQVKARRQQKEAWVEEALHCRGGLFSKLLRYLQLRLPTLHQYCAICDEPHTASPMIQRTVCHRELCSWRFLEFGKLISDADGVNSTEEVTDLLVCMAIHAARSPRIAAIIDPFPVLFVDGISTPVLSSTTPNAHKILQKVMEQVVDARESGNGTMWLSQVELMRSRGELVLPMVRWIRSSIRCFLMPLAPEAQVPDFRTEFQYLLVSAAPEREAEFQRLKAEKGSCFAFHGSPPENWHGIMRNGLKNASHTELMIRGAVHGPGIYLSPDSGISASYSRLAHGKVEPPAVKRGSFSLFPEPPPPPPVQPPPGPGGRCVGTRTMNLSTLKNVAVCEVIKDESMHKHGSIWVCPKEETVVTRFLLVYADEMPHVNLEEPSLFAQLLECTKRFEVLRCAS